MAPGCSRPTPRSGGWQTPGEDDRCPVQPAKGGREKRESDGGREREDILGEREGN